MDWAKRGHVAGRTEKGGRKIQVHVQILCWICSCTRRGKKNEKRAINLKKKRKGGLNLEREQLKNKKEEYEREREKNGNQRVKNRVEGYPCLLLGKSQIWSDPVSIDVKSPRKNVKGQLT